MCIHVQITHLTQTPNKNLPIWKGAPVLPVNILLTFVSKENGRAKVSSQDDHALRLRSDLDNPGRSAASAKIIRPNRVQVGGREVGEEEEGVPATLRHHGSVKNVLGGDVDEELLREDDPHALVGVDVEDQD